MPKLWTSILKKTFNYIGDHSGCHQIPQRCFKLNGYIFPLCARCCGVYVGQILSLICGILGFRLNFLYSIILILIMGFDWFIQRINIKESTNIRRFVTGILGGFGLFQIYFLIFDFVSGILSPNPY
ncbi:MAG: DUF2085 domain-containing protein [Lachnospirales bacterium]